MVWLFAILPVFSTLLGGWAVLRFEHRLHPTMAFAAGVLVATALSNLLPESTELLDERAVLVGGLAVVGYLIFSALEAQLHRVAWEHQHDPTHPPEEPHEHASEAIGLIGAAWLILHSLLDGLAIGAGFAAGAETGLIVGLAVLAHDFADGINLATLALLAKRRPAGVFALLVIDAVAAPVGAFIGTLAAVPDEALGGLLAIFAGAFLALGAGHLLPEAQHRQPGRSPALVALATLGALLVLAVRQLLEA
jgi:ZIP family zinc transporter